MVSIFPCIGSGVHLGWNYTWIGWHYYTNALFIFCIVPIALPICFQRILPLSISFWHIFLTSEKILGGEEKRVVGGEETFFPIWDFPLFWRGELTFLWSKKMIKVTVKIMLMKSRKSFSLNISSSSSLKFKNVSQLAFTYSNSAIKYQEQSVQYV